MADIPTAPEIEEKRREAQGVVLDEIIKVTSTTSASAVAKLAEAYAWIASPGQAHGGAD